MYTFFLGCIHCKKIEKYTIISLIVFFIKENGEVYNRDI